MKVLILAAGYGTRLYPLTLDRPKPLLEVGGKPIVNYLIDKVRWYSGVNEVVVVTNNKFYPHFSRWAKANKSFPVPVSVVNDGTKTNEDRLGSMGDIDFVIKKKNIREDLLVMGGDNLFDLGLNNYFFHAQKNSPRTTIGLYDILDIGEAKKFGVVELDAQKKVVSFMEKPDQPRSTLIGMCLYYLPAESLKRVREYLHASKSADTSGDYIRWLFTQETVFGFKFEGKWYDIGSIEAYHAAQSEFRKT